jgi:hypothetical protein
VTRAKISEYSATANDNTDVNGVNIAEGCPPSSMNNMGREIMAALKRFQVGSDGDGVTVGGALVVSGATTLTTVSATVVQSDTVSEKTSAAGVTIDGVLLKDNGVVTGAGTVSAPVYSTTGDLNTGIFFPAADQVAVATNGVERVNLGNSATVFNDGGADVDFRVEGDADANLLFVDASADRVGIGTNSPGCKLEVAGLLRATSLTNPSSGSGIEIGYDGTQGVIQAFSNRATATLAPVSIVGDLKFNSGYGSLAIAYGCRAWVNFNGSGTVAIRASGNVSSITDNGTGDYTVNFTTAMPDANFAVTWECDQVMPFVPNSNATGSCQVVARNSTNTNTDCVAGYASIFR